MTRTIPLAALSNTPISLASGTVGRVETIEARNPHATDGAYVKLYRSVAAPTGASVPTWKGWIAAASARTLSVFADGSHWWIAVATEASAGLSAPSTAFEAAVTFEQRRVAG